MPSSREGVLTRDNCLHAARVLWIRTWILGGSKDFRVNWDTFISFYDSVGFNNVKWLPAPDFISDRHTDGGGGRKMGSVENILALRGGT
jgi:hypothetical protein